MNENLYLWCETSFYYWRNRDADNALFFWQLGWLVGINWGA